LTSRNVTVSDDPWSFAKNPSSDLFDVLLHSYDDGLAFEEWLQRLIASRGLERSEVVRRSYLKRVSAYQIIAGMRRGTRDKLIQLARGMDLNIEDTCELLERGGVCALRPSSRRDATIAYCIARGFSVPVCDDVLARADMQPLRPDYDDARR
jgi:transcriptional regulator with XRE-family HTH domain